MILYKKQTNTSHQKLLQIAVQTKMQTEFSYRSKIWEARCMRKVQIEHAIVLMIYSITKIRRIVRSPIDPAIAGFNNPTTLPQANIFAREEKAVIFGQ